jgi:flagellar hook protein FlgE
MSSVAAIGLSGLNAASLRLSSAAHNVANLQTPGFRRQQVLQQAQPEGGVQAQITRAAQPGAALAQDVVMQIEASAAYRASLGVVKTEHEMLGRLLDLKA